MDFIYYEGIIMAVTKIKNVENGTRKAKELQKIIKNTDDFAGILPFSQEMKAPDCVFETIVKRMDELNKEINEYESILTKLKGEYKAHANFILNGPFGRRDLSQSSENTD